MSSGVTEPSSSCVGVAAEEGILAEVELDHEALLLAPTLRRTPEAVVEPEYTTTLDSGRRLSFVSVRADCYDAFETALAVDGTVTEPVLLDRYDDRRVYRLAMTDRAMTVVPETAECGARVIDTTGGRDGWSVRLRLPDRDALVAFGERCRDRDISFSVRYLRTATESAEALVGLTPKQQELLTVAYEEGYFSVPRDVSQTELADRLNVSKSAISQRLRRAIGELCGSTLATVDDA